MKRQQNLSQDARRKADAESAAAHRAERHDQMRDMNLARDDSGGDYEPADREDQQGTDRPRARMRDDRHAAEAAAHDAVREANTEFDR
ncbi:hypothetical protein [Nocardia sp. NPDC005978]|uniref:hypothetical protein n=1 Tax=unclassified Nocardia TaxID=2637762 RepID=UPI0033A796DF